MALWPEGSIEVCKRENFTDFSMQNSKKQMMKHLQNREIDYHKIRNIKLFLFILSPIFAKLVN